MCGRYTQFTPADELEVYFEAITSNAAPISPNYNVTPGSIVPVVATGRDRVPVITTFRWGLVPSWAEDIRIGYQMINARSETIAQKRSFARPFQRSRCVVPSNGFYEWKRDGKAKIPYFLRRSDDEIMTFAGIYDRWRQPEGGPDLFSFSIITTSANPGIREIHDRMPVILDKAEVRDWLNPAASASELQKLMQPLPVDRMTLYPVSDAVNKPVNNYAELMDPLSGDGNM